MIFFTIHGVVVKIVGLILSLGAIASCGSDYKKHSDVQSLKTKNNTMLYVEEIFEHHDAYCVLWKKSGDAKLLTASGGISEDQIRRSFRSIDNIESIVNWAVIGTVATGVGITNNMPIFSTVAIGAILFSSVYLATDLIVGHRNANKLISRTVVKISNGNMDRIVRRISSETSSIPGSCDHLIEY